MGLFNLFKLEKLEIDAFDDSARSLLDRAGGFKVMFNPESFTMKHRNWFGPIQGLNSSGRTARFSHSTPIEVRLDLHIDGTGVGDFGLVRLLGGGADSVSDQIAEFREVCFEFDGSIHQPRFLRLNWGDGPLKAFDCRLKALSIDYSSFDKNGAPLAAKVTATFVEDMDASKRARRDAKSSPDLTHRRTVMAGDTLPFLCKKIYGSSSHYLWVARANGLDDFRNLQPGDELLFPPLAT